MRWRMSFKASLGGKFLLSYLLIVLVDSAYFASSFQNRLRLVAMTFLFAGGVATIELGQERSNLNGCSRPITILDRSGDSLCRTWSGCSGAGLDQVPACVGDG